MLKTDKWRTLPSSNGEMAINWTGQILLREKAKNCLYAVGSGEIFLQPEDLIFMHAEYQAWLAAGNTPVPPGAVVCM